MSTMKKLSSALITVLLAAITLSFTVIDETEPPADEDQVRPLAIVTRFRPTVEKFTKEDGRYVMDVVGEKLFSGDTLVTQKDGYALVVFASDKSVAKVKPESMLIVNGESSTTSKMTNRLIDLKEGSIKLEIEPIGSGSFEVKTSRSLASVKGTVFGNDSKGYIWVKRGQVDVTALNSGQTVSLFEQMFANVDPGGNSVESGTLTDQQLNSLDEGYDELDEDMIEKTIIIRFRDANGQVREIPVNILEKGNN
ncbi:MAG TPA: hypothetical protein DEQ34_03495 [Balneolaceae bacterium]|nr:hypothetical protein [Balneolaceae bacterium]|tara:strand:+ start:11697 stop:12452 length:756 start_codon:yes stop_codon:yes gene_type:complete